MESLNTMVGKRIREARKMAGLTQEELGKGVGLSKATVAKYENGQIKSIDVNILYNMALKCDCSPEYLSGWSSKPRSDDSNKSISSQYKGVIHQLRRLGAFNEDGSLNEERFNLALMLLENYEEINRKLGKE